MKKIFVVSALTICCLEAAQSQPPLPPKATRPAAPPITLKELERETGGPTIVTLRFKDAKHQEVLNELSKQGNVQVRGNVYSDDQRNKKYSIEVDKKPFWDAIAEIGDKMKLFPQQWGGQNGMVLSPDNDGSPRGATQLATPLLSIVAKTISRTHTVNFKPTLEAGKTPPETPSMTLQTVILLDPKLRLLNNATKAAVNEIVDDKGKSLKGDQDEIWVYGESPLQWQMQVPLKYSATMGKKIARLQGSFRAFVIARHEKWEIPDVMKAKGATKTVKIGNRDETYTLEEIVKEGDSVRIKILLKRELEIAPPSAQNTPEAQQLKYARRDWSRWMRLSDAKGNTYQGYNSGGGEEEMNFTFNSHQQYPDDEKAGEPDKLLIDIPLEFRQLEVPFTFKDLVLP
jgi:hypothetical protein